MMWVGGRGDPSGVAALPGTGVAGESDGGAEGSWTPPSVRSPDRPEVGWVSGRSSWLVFSGMVLCTFGSAVGNTDPEGSAVGVAASGGPRFGGAVSGATGFGGASCDQVLEAVSGWVGGALALGGVGTAEGRGALEVGFLAKKACLHAGQRIRKRAGIDASLSASILSLAPQCGHLATLPEPLELCPFLSLATSKSSGLSRFFRVLGKRGR